MGLREYQRKRNFGRTPEPAAASPAATDGRAGAKAKPAVPQSLAQATTPAGAFVVQKHDASRLHYDFRLELDGVLKSWAVPKGPCLDPTEKRLAVQTEDHPLEYTEFEGVIPEGSYGGGTMMVWDLGRWSPLGDAHRDYLAGKLKFRLDGQKLRGAWMLVRMPGNGAKGKANWLLFKERDSEARPLAEGDILAEMPFSASTGRSLDEIAAGKPARKRTARARARKTETASLQTISPALQKLAETHDVRFTNPDRILYPEPGVNKLDLANYYSLVAGWMLPHIAGRLLSLVRCPNGVSGAHFFQKHAPHGLSESVERIEVEKEGETEIYMAIHDLEGLVSLVQFNVLEIHVWGSRAESIDRPDRIVFDLDPDPSVSWESVVETAFFVRDALAEFGLVSFVKTTGGKGLHVTAPVERRHDWDQVSQFAKAFADLLASVAPSRYTSNPIKSARRGKIYIDYLRNGRGSTAVAPYSTRAKVAATVSCPLAWDELSSVSSPAAFTVRNMPRRVSLVDDDPWREMGSIRQTITAATRKRLGLR